MNKIINWTLGGFFRTLGRILVYLCVGILITILFNKSGFKLPFMTVNAQTVDYSDYSQSIYMYMQNWGSTQNSKNHLYSSSTSKTSSYFSPYIYSNLNGQPYPFLQKDKYYSLTFLLGDGEHQIYPNWESLISDNKISSSSIFSGTFTYITIWYSNNDTNSADVQSQVVGDYLNYLNITDIVVDSSMTYNRYFITYVFSPKIDMRRLNFRANFKDNSVSSSKTYFYNLVSFGEINESDIPSLFDNINDVINDLIDAVTDTADLIGEHLENGTLLDLFPQFEINTQHVLTNIATLPLESLNAILENNYEDLCGVIKGTTFCLPNGDLIWERDNTTTLFGSANYDSFKDFIELFLGGGMIWLCCLSLFRTLHHCLEPDNTDLEVLKL